MRLKERLRRLRGNLAGRRALWIASLVCLLVTAVLIGPVLWIDARNLELDTAATLEAEASIRSALLQFLGGLLLVSGLVITARTLVLTREGHITDRYASAIEQLGHDSRDVRLGGIFALERIARDSESDRATVVAVLTAYVRSHTTSAPRVPKTERIDVDVQAALTVLGRRPSSAEEEVRLDLSHCGLIGADLGGDFDHATFVYSELTQAIFTGGSFVGADISFTKARTVGFNDCSARGVHFVHASWINCWFINSDLSGADFYGCDLSGTDMGRRYSDSGAPNPASRLDGARFTQATLQGTNLSGSDLSRVRGLEPDQLAQAQTDQNTLAPFVWGEPDDCDG